MVTPLDSSKALRFEGQIIVLRRHQPEDYRARQKILNDADTMKALQPYFKIEHWTDEMVQNRYEKFDADPTALVFSVCRQSDGVVVGDCGFKNLELRAGNAWAKRCSTLVVP
jgi:RimJ/RimL family protein N-acetyltransferase